MGVDPAGFGALPLEVSGRGSLGTLGPVDASLLAVICVGACALAITLIVVAPWRRVRDEPPLEPDVQTRLLLGDSPEEVAAEADAAEARRWWSPDHRSAAGGGR